MSGRGTSTAYTQRTVELALANVEQGGKPFACLVVDAGSGDVLNEPTNQVAQTGDFTAHAEITAIRELAGVGRTSLEGCDVYVTASPCPMCLGALSYAAPDQQLPSTHIATDDPTAPFRLWTSSHPD